MTPIEPSDPDLSDETFPSNPDLPEPGDLASANDPTSQQLENHMEQAFLADRAATTRLGWISTIAWGSAASILTAGGMLAVMSGEEGGESLRIPMVAISIPGFFLLLLAVVTAVLWSRRSQRLTLETLQERLARIEALLKE